MSSHQVSRYSPAFESLRAVIQHPGAMATTLHSVAYKYFHEDIYSWDPEQLEMEFEDEFGVQVSPPGANKLHALITALVTDSFYTDWIVYGSIATALASEDGESEMTGPLSTAELAWGTTEVLLNDSRPAQWSPEVKRFAGTVVSEDGIVVPVPVLSFADMPQQYQGIGANPVQESGHKAVVEEFLEEQSVTLFKQLAALPWMTHEDLERLAAQVRLGDGQAGHQR